MSRFEKFDEIIRDTKPISLNRDPFACKTEECYRETCRRSVCPKVMPPSLPCPRSEQELLPLGERPCCGQRKQCVPPGGKTIHERDETPGNRDATDLRVVRHSPHSPVWDGRSAQGDRGRGPRGGTAARAVTVSNFFRISHREMWATRLLNAASLLLASAYATTLAWDVPRPALAYAALAPAAVAFVVEAWSPALPRSVGRSGILFVITNGGVAVGLGVGVEFAVAYAACALILAWIVVAQAQGLVRYDADTAAFVLSRSSLYGLIGPSWCT